LLYYYLILSYFLKRLCLKIEIYLSYNMLTIAHMTQIMTKRIPVSEEMWKQLGLIKQAGQTYDQLLREMMQAYNRKQLALKVKSAKKGKGNWHSLEDL
jgi:hypothetical protein